MANLKDYLSGTKYIRLNYVKYFNYDEDVQEKPILNCSDNYRCEYKDDSIEITVTRNVDFTPKCFFSAEVSYSVIHTFDESKYDSFDEKMFNLNEIIKDDISYYIPDEMDRVSLIISQISDSFEGRPLITSPRFKFKSKDDEK